MLSPTPGQPDSDFMHQLQIARLERLRTSRTAAASFAQDYTDTIYFLAFPQMDRIGVPHRRPVA